MNEIPARCRESRRRLLPGQGGGAGDSADLPRLDLVNELFKQVERQPATADEGIEALLRNLQAIAIR